MSGPVDLHLHSHYSDGSESPTTIAEMAAKAHLSAIALTDHDNTFGIGEVTSACAERGIEVIPGIELSLTDDEHQISRRGQVGPVHAHILVYWPPLDPASPFQVALADIRTKRRTRNETLLANLHAQGFTGVTWEDLVAEAGNEANLGKPHFAQVMLRRHPELVAPATADNLSAIYDNWIGDQGAAYALRDTLSLTDMMDVLRASEGGSSAVVAVAHPIRNYLGDASQADIETKLPHVFGTLRERGVQGVESLYASWNQSLRELVQSLAKKSGLIPTGGSDFHGVSKPDLAVGTGRGDLVVPRAVLEELIDARR